MDTTYSQPSNSHQTASGASKYLVNLPSRGLFSSYAVSSNPGRIRVYTCEHETSPPEEQLIKTNPTNILIRSLMLKKQKGDSCLKDAKGAAVAEVSKKRPAEKALDGRSSAKKAMTNAQTSSRREGSVSSTTRASDKDYPKLNVERLRALLKERGLSPKGKKDELIARLRSTNG